MSGARPTRPPRALVTLARAMGDDPLLVQGPGANFSVKTADGLWIKASGARAREVSEAAGLARVDAAQCLAAMPRPDGTPTAAEEAAYAAAVAGSRADDRQPRPSMELGFHAAIPYRWVNHTHSLAGVVVAALPPGHAAAAAALAPVRDAGWAVVAVPPLLPGLALSLAVARTVPALGDAPGCLWLLANHGVVWGTDDRAALDGISGAFEAAARAALGFDRLPLPAAPVPGRGGGSDSTLFHVKQSEIIDDDPGPPAGGGPVGPHAVGTRPSQLGRETRPRRSRGDTQRRDAEDAEGRRGTDRIGFVSWFRTTMLALRSPRSLRLCGESNPTRRPERGASGHRDGLEAPAGTGSAFHVKQPGIADEILEEALDFGAWPVFAWVDGPLYPDYAVFFPDPARRPRCDGRVVRFVAPPDAAAAADARELIYAQAALATVSAQLGGCVAPLATSIAGSVAGLATERLRTGGIAGWSGAAAAAGSGTAAPEAAATAEEEGSDG